jgi:hypothetical protein
LSGCSRDNMLPPVEHRKSANAEWSLQSGWDISGI